VYLFCVTNPQNLLNPVGGQPVIQLFVDSYNSFALSVLSSLVFLVTLLFAVSLVLLASSRVWWSFARIGAVPLAGWQGTVDRRLNVPTNSIVVVFVIEVALGALVFGPSQVLSTMVGCGTICFLLSYSVPIACFLSRGRANLPAKRYFNLGRWGPALNLVSILWILLVSFFLFFPVQYPVDNVNMNYSVVVVLGFLAVWAVVWVLVARKTYDSPIEQGEFGTDTEKERVRSEEGLLQEQT
jgi:choline transport protein